jgi:hypothetical protein
MILSINPATARFQRAAVYATALGYERGTHDWWQSIRHTLNLMKGNANGKQ